MTAGKRTDRSEFVLRLLVVKVEGVLVDPPSQWLGDLDGITGSVDLAGDELFPDWLRQVSTDESDFRQSLKQLATSDYFRLDPDLKNVITYAHDHSPIRVALLSGGPEEWVEGLTESLGISDQVDVPYSYDRYTHGTRRTLLQFLMNRFIAGRGRTLFLGNTVADEQLADREETRFRSFRAPPSDALNVGDWEWDADQLLEFMKEKQPSP